MRGVALKAIRVALLTTLMAGTLAACTGQPAPAATSVPKKEVPATEGPAPAKEAKPAAEATKPAAPKPTAAPASPTPVAAKKLSYGEAGSPPDLAYIVTYVAKDGGFFKKNGLDVDWKELGGDIPALQGLLAGDLQIIGVGSSSAMAAVAKGGAMKAISSYAAKQDYVFVAQASVKDVKDLAGKNVAVSRPGSISYHLPRLVMKNYGLDPEKAQYVALGTDTNRFNALVAKQVDATLLHASRAVKAESNPNLHIIANVAKEVPNFQFTYNVIRDDVLQKDPDIAKRFVKAIIEASRFASTNKKETIEIAKKYIPNTPDEELSKTYDLLKEANVWGVDGGLDAKAYEETVDLLVTSGDLTAKLPMDKMVVSRFADEVLKELGPYKP